MAAENSTENFQGRASFFFLGDFGMIFFFFFFQNVQHKILFQNMELVFFQIWAVAPKNGSKVKKVGPKAKQRH